MSDRRRGAGDAGGSMMLEYVLMLSIGAAICVLVLVFGGKVAV